jgi:putative hydrolase of the HAD superfamily
VTAVAFDLGDTLVEYEGLPLSWEAHYGAALASLTAELRLGATPDQIAQACGVLRRYNTRLQPRTNEVSFSTILRELLACFADERDVEVDEAIGAAAFFRVFRQRLRCFDDVRPTLTRLRAQRRRLGVFTDVPYGMPRALVLEDLAQTKLSDAFDMLLTSRDVGFRKPSPATLQALAERLGCGPKEMAYVGNERKDVEVARAFGCLSILLDRTGAGQEWGQDFTIRSLAEL